MRKQLWKCWPTVKNRLCQLMVSLGVTPHLPGAESLEEEEERKAPDHRGTDDAEQGDELDPLSAPELDGGWGRSGMRARLPQATSWPSLDFLSWASQPLRTPSLGSLPGFTHLVTTSSSSPHASSWVLTLVYTLSGPPRTQNPVPAKGPGLLLRHGLGVPWEAPGP